MNDNDTIGPGPTEATIEMLADIVAAYVAHNRVPVGELPALIAATHAALVGLDRSATPAKAEVDKPTPAQVRKSIAHDGLTSFIDGKSYKTLKRHLTKHGLDAASYRERYGLPPGYPMVAPNYSEQRATLAKGQGLGQARRRATPPADAAE